MVANSVSGLVPSKVTVVDQNGDTLWPDGADSADAGGMPALLAARMRTTSPRRQGQGYLAEPIGFGKALVSVSAELNSNQISQSSLVYQGRACRRPQRRRRSR